MLPQKSGSVVEPVVVPVFKILNEPLAPRRIPPATSSFARADVVPIPTLPFANTVKNVLPDEDATLNGLTPGAP